MTNRMRLIPYLVMNGNGREAIRFYESALGGQVLNQLSFGEMPENPEFPLPPDAKDLVSHAVIQIGESELMLSDTFPGQPHQTGNQVTICLSLNDPEKARQYYEALREGGRVNMELQETFFSPAYGSVTDKFGVTFQIYAEGSH
nr:VOC family protein [Cohnella xylanilytica]